MKKMSTSEAIIMKIIWESHEELSSSDVHKIINEQFSEMNWEATTVSTFLTRLVNKGILSVHLKGRTNYYYPIVTSQEYKSNLLSEKIKKKFNLTPTELFLTFAGKEVNKESIEKLENMMKNWDEYENS